jgi:hypothetical protein
LKRLWLQRLSLYIKRLNDVLGISQKKDIYKQLFEKIKNINPNYLKEDILPLFEDTRFIELYCKNYKEMIKKYLI